MLLFLVKMSFDVTSFDRTSLDGTSFDRTSLDGTSYDGTSFHVMSFDLTSSDHARWLWQSVLFSLPRTWVLIQPSAIYLLLNI